MSVGQVEQQMVARMGELESLNATIKFECKNEGVIFIDATGRPATISNDDGMADCTFKITSQNLNKLLTGKLDPMLAYSMGKLKIKGSMGVAMKLASILN